MPRTFSQIEVQLRRAVLAQSYAEVQRLVRLFCEAVEAHVRALAPGDPSIPQIAEMAQEVLAWCTSAVRADRDSLASQLKLIPKVKPYLVVASGSTSGLRFEV